MSDASTALTRLTLAVLCIGGAGRADEPVAKETVRYEWPMVAGNAGWTGFSSDARVKPPFRLKWVAKTEACIRAGVSVAAGRVFTSGYGYMFCFDAETGRVLWDRHVGGNSQTTSCDGRRVYVYAGGGLLALAPATGKTVWRRSSGGCGVTGSFRTSPVFDDGVIYFGRQDAEGVYFEALKADSGEPIWSTRLWPKTKPERLCPPALGGGMVFSSSPTSKVTFALDRKTGTPVWRKEGPYANIALSTDGRHVWVANARDGLTALDVKTGEKAWHWGGTESRKAFYTWQGTANNPPTVAFGRLFCKSYGGFFSVLDPSSGKLDWTFDDGAGTGCAMPSAAGGHLYFCTGNYAPKTDGGRYVHAIDPATRKSVWRYRTGGRVCGRPAIAHGRLYVSGNDGRAYCFEPVNADYRAPQPQPAPKEPAGPLTPLAEKLTGTPGAPGHGEKPKGGTDWPMYGGCPQRCGLEVEIGLPIQPAWKFQTGGTVRSSPVIADGGVYVGSDCGTLFALDLATGRKKWTVEIGSRVRSAPAVAGGLVVCGADDGVLRAFDAASGRTAKWEFRTGGPILASPAIVGERVVFGSCDHRCYCVRLSDGREFWRFKARHEIHAPPAIARGVVYVGTWMWKLHGLDLGTGKPVKGFDPRRGYSITSCGRVEGVAVYLGVVATTNAKDENGGGSYALAADTGKVLAASGGGFGFGAAAFSGKWMFATPAWNGVSCFDLQRQKVLRGRRAQCGLPMLNTPLTTEDLMFAATKAGTVEVRTILRGGGAEPSTLLWRWNSPGGRKIATAPAAAAGVIVLGSDDGCVYAFRYGSQHVEGKTEE